MNEKKKKRKNEETEKIRKFSRNSVQKKRGDMFSNVGEMKNRWYKNLTQKGDVKQNSNFQNIFEAFFFFQKWTKKESQKCKSFQNEGFFGQKKLKRQKNWRCES